MSEELYDVCKASGCSLVNMTKLIFGHWKPQDRNDFIRRNPYLASRYFKNITPDEEQLIFLGMLEQE